MGTEDPNNDNNWKTSRNTRGYFVGNGRPKEEDEDEEETVRKL